MAESDITFACPRCAVILTNGLTCTKCGTAYELSGGVYHFLLPERRAEIHAFLTQYRFVRGREGYRSLTSEDYRSLPDIRTDHPQAEVWRVRRQSYERLLSILDGQSFSILDLGAGNGWLSHRLARLGHYLLAVDWLEDEQDGLGAYRNYDVNYTSVQADFIALPLSGHQFDIVIFNASLHYSLNMEETLHKVRKMLRSEGRIFVIDSPTFSSDQSGQVMVREHIDHLRQSHGLHEIIQPGAGYLTVNKMMEFGKTLNIAFRFYQSNGPFLWEIKRWWTGVKGKREPARFGVWEGKLL